MLAHAYGWPLVKGGTQRLADALVAHLRELGAEVSPERKVTSFRDLPKARAYLFDVTPRQLLGIAAAELPSRYARRLSRFRYGPGVFKLDLALSEPVPWKAGSCARAGTVHVAGSYEDFAASEKEVWEGRHPERPYVLVAQQSLFDDTRAPAGTHTLWAYCHVPHGSDVDMTDRIEAQIERFAPGFRDTIVARHTMTAVEMERRNSNYVGGDINGGVQDLRQLFTRPVARFDLYSTPNPQIYLCSSSTPPGGGVHGMCGYSAARSVLRKLG
ncbi:MAG: NAD(P)/FAD-dependent oxidoreductase, partial [Actinomycetota bacterium]|nr:NAD(P)/FAD-dependent oxidoreductase [Actinomycetota bacterium]